MTKVATLPTSLPRPKIADSARGKTSSCEYIPKSLLGEGAAGAVYLAHRILNLEELPIDLFAIKILCPLRHIARTEHSNDRIAARFRAEAQRGRKLHHQNLLQISDYGRIVGGGPTWNGAPFYAMPFIEGDALNTLFANAVPPVQRRHRWAIELTDAVAYLHSLGVLHRDIKPHNILIERKTQRLLLGDYGVVSWGDYAPQYTDGVATY